MEMHTTHFQGVRECVPCSDSTGHALQLQCEPEQSVSLWLPELTTNCVEPIPSPTNLTSASEERAFGLTTASNTATIDITLETSMDPITLETIHADHN